MISLRKYVTIALRHNVTTGSANRCQIMNRVNSKNLEVLFIMNYSLNWNPVITYLFHRSYTNRTYLHCYSNLYSHAKTNTRLHVCMLYVSFSQKKAFDEVFIKILGYFW